MIDDLPDKLENNVMKCANCIQSKMANVPFENERSKTSEILELIHTILMVHTEQQVLVEKIFF